MAKKHAQPDWYSDPSNKHELRYWDGQQWTDDVSDTGVVSKDEFEVKPVTSSAEVTIAAPQAIQIKTEILEPGVIWQAISRSLKTKATRGFSATKYKLTDEFLFFEKAGLRTNAQQVPIMNVIDIDVKQSMAQKAIGTGDLRLQVQKADGSQEIVLIESIQDFREAQRILNETSKAARLQSQQRNSTRIHINANTEVATSAATAPNQTSVADELTKLAGLRDAGVLTQEEFDKQKQLLLNS